MAEFCCGMQCCWDAVGRHESAEEKWNGNSSEHSGAKGEVTGLLAEGHKKRCAIGLRSILEYYLIGATAKQGAHLPYCCLR
jgi:hypothetical protein